MVSSQRITVLGIILNSILFIAKLVVGIISGSVAVLSDAFNSLTDILSSIGIFFAVRLSDKRADHSHPFGHHRAEPLAGFITAIFAGILGFEILRTAIRSLLAPVPTVITLASFLVLVFTIIVKLVMAIVFIRVGEKQNRPAIKATGIDSRNDVLVSGLALVGFASSLIGVEQLDAIAAIIISMVIFYSAYKIAIENVDYLMGKAPSEDLIEKIKEKTLKVKGVKGINDVRAHYVGNYIHIEIHVEVDEKISTKKSHDIGKDVEHVIENMDVIDKAFVHIDPVRAYVHGKKPKKMA